MSLHLLLIVLNRCHLTNNYLLLSAYKPQLVAKAPNKSLHLILDSTSSIVFGRFVLHY